MTRTEFFARWTKRGEEFKQFSAMVDGNRIVTGFLSELDKLFREEDSEVLTLEQAADRSGYSVDHLARSLRSGVIPNAGRKGQPRIRCGDLPHKPGSLPKADPTGSFDRRQIALSVVNSNHEKHDG